MDSYVGALRSCAEARGEGLLLFERYMGNSQFEHMHLQAIPLPSATAAGARAAFESHGRRLGLGFELLPAGGGNRPPPTQLFHTWRQPSPHPPQRAWVPGWPPPSPSSP